MSTAHGRIVLRLGSPEVARRAEAALAPDNDGHLATRVEADALVLEASATTALGLLRTVDDALACLRATGLP